MPLAAFGVNYNFDEFPISIHNSLILFAENLHLKCCDEEEKASKISLTSKKSKKSYDAS